LDQQQRQVINRIVAFLKLIGMGVITRAITEPTLMPGIAIESGAIIIDTDKLLYPGDILHEAGHLATAPPEARRAMNGTLPEGFDYLGDEIAAQAWSYAASVHLGLDARVVFHSSGYHDGGEGLSRIYSTSDIAPGVPLLQWMDMTHDKKNAEKLNTLAYPHMISWVRPS
jgi:hypothetical protein